MKKKALQDLEATLMKEVVRRRQLGGYSMEAEGILLIAETTLRIVQHLIEASDDAAEQQEADALQPTDRKRSGAGGRMVK